MVGPAGGNDGGRAFRLLNFFILPSSLFPRRFIPLFWRVIKNKQLYSLWGGAVLAAVSLYITNSNTDTQPRKTKTFYPSWDRKSYTMRPRTADVPVFSATEEKRHRVVEKSCCCLISTTCCFLEKGSGDMVTIMPTKGYPHNLRRVFHRCQNHPY